MKDRTAQRLKSERAWSVWLSLLIVSIAWSPRLRFGGGGDAKAFDIRVQDVLLLPTLLALLLSTIPWPKLGHVWGPWAVAFGFLSTGTAALHLLLTPTAAISRAVPFHGRAVELLFIAVAFAGCYVAAGERARESVIRALNVAVWVNLTWMMFQYAAGTQEVLFGSLGNTIEAYGPKLVGEPSAFGTGFFCATAVAWGASRYFAGEKRTGAALMIMVGALATFASESRISLGAAVIVLAVLIVRPDVRKGVNLITITASLAVIVVIIGLAPESNNARLTTSGLEASTTVRVDKIWGPLWSAFVSNPLLGIGPGALGTTDQPLTEAHNVFLRAGLDYGLIAGLAFIAILFTTFFSSWRSRNIHGEAQIFAAFAQSLVAAILVAGLVQESMTAVMSSHLMMMAIGLYGGAQFRVDRSRHGSMAGVNDQVTPVGLPST